MADDQGQAGAKRASAAETIGARSVPAPAPLDEVTIEGGLEVGQAVEDPAR